MFRQSTLSCLNIEPANLQAETDTAVGKGLRCPRHESNMRTRFRKPLLYPLSYGGA